MVGTRNTIQRALVLETVRRVRCHATADEIYLAIVQDHPNISRATVYRNLNLLSESGEIQKVEVPDGPDRFDHICEDHYHIRCTNCGRVFDVDMDYMPDIMSRVRDAHGFTFTDHIVMFRGVCPDCTQTH